MARTRVANPRQRVGTKPVSSLRKTSLHSVFLVRNDMISNIHADGQSFLLYSTTPHPSVRYFPTNR